MQKILLKNATILDGTETMEPHRGDILISHGKIEKIGQIPEQKDFRVYDLSGKYIMPGLINMHVHLAGNGKPQKKQRDNARLVNTIFSVPFGSQIAFQMVRKFAELELLSGVTTIRTVGGLKNFDTRLRDEIHSGRVKGPRVLAANQGISVPGGHMAGSVATTVTTPEEAASEVRKRADEGVNLIKLMITGGVMDAREKGVPGEVRMAPELVRAACDEAHRRNLIVAAHTESTEGVRLALQNGVDSIEHGAKPDDEILSLFKEKHAFVTTTLSPALPYALFDSSVSHTSEVEKYNGNIVFEGIKECAKTALQNGIPVALGNDVGCPWVSQYDFWRELVYFQKYCHVSSRFALYTATLNNARLAGIGEITGSLEEGKAADMIVTSSDPLNDLRVLRHIDMVIAGGNLLDSPSYRRNTYVDSQLDPYLQ